MNSTEFRGPMQSNAMSILLGLDHGYHGNISQDILDLLNETDFYDALQGELTSVVDDQWHTVVIILYSLVIIFGFFANMLVVVVIFRYKQLHTVTNIFICYLAIADVALCVFNLPIQLHYQLSNNWMFGRLLCHVAMPTFGVPLFSSTLSILMIAIDRYMLIVYPFKKRMTNSQAIITVILIVVFTIALSTPLIVFVDYVELTYPVEKTYCSEKWPSFVDKQVYSVSNFLLQFVLPLCLTSFFYKHICHVLHNRPVKKHDTRRNQRTNKILISVVLTFTVCWLPWSLFSLTAEFSHQLVKGRYFTLTDLTLKVFAMSSACINPFLYGWLNDNFKKELEKLFQYCICWRESTTKRRCALFSRTADTNETNVKSETNLRCIPDVTVV